MCPPTTVEGDADTPTTPPTHTHQHNPQAPTHSHTTTPTQSRTHEHTSTPSHSYTRSGLCSTPYTQPTGWHVRGQSAGVRPHGGHRRGAHSWRQAWDHRICSGEVHGAARSPMTGLGLPHGPPAPPPGSGGCLGACDQTGLGAAHQEAWLSQQGCGSHPDTGLSRGVPVAHPQQVRMECLQLAIPTEEGTCSPSPLPALPGPQWSGRPGFCPAWREHASHLLFPRVPSEG